ncbi:MAG: efflux RND transporter periplasmic adaptor subunit [Anaerolineae bacterium]|nr:efflux RND transporter periplasmic adaptor subunit [Anaerolineae bacterium]
MEKETSKRKSKNTWIWIVGTVLVIVGIIFAARQVAISQAQSQPSPETTTAFTGDISGTITGSGHLQPRQDVSLSMATTGIVATVNVEVGDTVKAGEVLVRLDDTDARQTLAKAELQVASAELNVQSAQNTLDSRVFWAPNQKQVAAAEAELANAEASLADAQSLYDKVAWLPGVSASQPSLNLEKATNSYDVAKANLDYLYSNKPDVQSAAISFETAKLSLQEAQINLESAQTALDKTILKAPFAGTITTVNVAVGEAANGVVIEMVSKGSLEAVLDIDEIDIGALEVGQSAIVTLTTWPDAQIEGQVTFIAPQANKNTGSDVINYQVRLSLGETDLQLRAGMTTNATIMTFSLEDVLLVSNRAISADREAGKYYVNVITGQGVEKTEVTIGVNNETYSQILSGLEEGDVLLINGSAPVLNFGPDDDGEINRPSNGGMFGGGGR